MWYSLQALTVFSLSPLPLCCSIWSACLWRCSVCGRSWAWWLRSESCHSLSLSLSPQTLEHHPHSFLTSRGSSKAVAIWLICFIFKHCLPPSFYLINWLPHHHHHHHHLLLLFFFFSLRFHWLGLWDGSWGVTTATQLSGSHSSLDSQWLCSCTSMTTMCCTPWRWPDTTDKAIPSLPICTGKIPNVYEQYIFSKGNLFFFPKGYSLGPRWIVIN